jgi:opacity protein-like surface antigen
MKTKLRLITFVAVCALTSVQSIPAQDYWSRFFIKADAGPAWTQDTDLEEFFGEDVSGADVEFETAMRLGFTFGFIVTSWFAVEAETGFVSGEIDSISGANHVDAWFSNVPLLINVRFQYPRDSFIRPYIGAGAGLSFSGLDADHIDIGTTHMDGYEDDVVFAYQFFAGLRFRINERMGIGVEYHYFGTTEPEFDADVGPGFTSDVIRFGKIETHAVTVAFDYRF